MENVFASTVYEFSTDILETGWIDNVKLYISIDGKTKEFSCEFLQRYNKKEKEITVFYSKFIYYISFNFSNDIKVKIQETNLADIYVKKSSLCQYFFTYYINGTFFKTQPIYFKVVL